MSWAAGCKPKIENKMKRIVLIAIMTMFLPDMNTQAQTASGTKVLVAYFSHSGNTREVARQISEATGGDLFEIVPELEKALAERDEYKDRFMRDGERGAATDIEHVLRVLYFMRQLLDGIGMVQHQAAIHQRQRLLAFLLFLLRSRLFLFAPAL